MLLFQGMRTLRPILIALTAVAAVSLAYPAKANLITNPGFEDLPEGTGWSFTSNAGVAGGSAPHSGVRAGDVFRNHDSISQSVATTSGTTYTIDFFAKCGDSGNLAVTFGGTVFNHLFSQSSGYTELTFNATAASANTNLSFSETSGNIDIFIDDISVNPAGVGVPDGGTTVSLLGCALLGLAGLRRKLGC